MKTKHAILTAAFLLLAFHASAGDEKTYWNSKIQLLSHRLPPAPAGYQPEFLDRQSPGNPSSAG